ncbi:type I toxin-antitoxin system hok family toxin [Edwardsiella piscicida]|nr:type I toxin-antitoxin system hok family toxin [Edwardsiella piscicida]
MEPQKPALIALIVISITLLGVLLLTNKSPATLASETAKWR